MRVLVKNPSVPGGVRAEIIASPGRSLADIAADFYAFHPSLPGDCFALMPVPIREYEKNGGE